MPEDDDVPIRIRSLDFRGRIAQSTPPVARRIVATRVRAPVRERRRKIGVNPTKGFDREGIPQQVADRAVSFVFDRSKPVAVLDVRTPRSYLVSPWSEDVVDAHILAEHVAAPTIVVSGDHQDRHACIDDVGKRGERAKTSSRNHRFPFEPKLEKVAVDDERFSLAGHMAKKGNDRLLDLSGRKPEVRVGNDVARRVEHARILPAVFTLYKRMSPDELGGVTNEPHATLLEPLYHDVEFRVRYAETDQMGVVYHTNYMIWCEVGRTDFIRARGMSYADMERAGVGLAVSDMSARFHAAARYDELIRVRTTLAEVRSRGITFDYLITRAADGHRLVSARTALVSIDRTGRPIALPAMVRSLFDHV